jgi:hypothetical protein
LRASGSEISEGFLAIQHPDKTVKNLLRTEDFLEPYFHPVAVRSGHVEQKMDIKDISEGSAVGTGATLTPSG